jgi:SAM-dependent methyltransferase
LDSEAEENHMKDEILPLLCEPSTGADLELLGTKVRNGETWEGTVRSTLTGKEYPIRQGIPRFVLDDGYTESFGLQWNRFRRVQLDSATGRHDSHDRFDQEVGWTSEDLAGRWTLDAGCGSGRFSEVAAERGAKVIAMDYSGAIDAAAENLQRFPNVHPVQGDLLNPPIRPRSVDFVYSLGVVQHTPDRNAALSSMIVLLRPCGRFAFTIYRRRWYTRFNAKYLVRPLTRRLPPGKLLRFLETVMPVLFPVTSVLFSIPGAGRLFNFMIPVANYVDKPAFARELRYQEALLDTFDMLSPAYDCPMTPSEVRRLLDRVGVREYHFRSELRAIVVCGSVPRLQV